jgi:hypothetical protein
MKTKKGLLIGFILIILILGLVTFRKDNSSLKNNTITSEPYPTIGEIEARPEFKDLKIGSGGGYVKDKSNIAIEVYVEKNVYWPVKKAIFVLHGLKQGGTTGNERLSLPVYDILSIDANTYCSSSCPEETDVTFSCIGTNASSSVVAVYSTVNSTVYKAWSINPSTLKFENYQDLKSVNCHLEDSEPGE